MEQTLNQEDITKTLLNFVNIRSFKVHWKSKEIVLRFDTRQEMAQFVSLMDLIFATEEDILEEDEKEEE